MDPIKPTGITQQDANSQASAKIEKDTDEEKSLFGAGLIEAGAESGEFVKDLALFAFCGAGAVFGSKLAEQVKENFEDIKEEVKEDIDALKEEVQKDIDALKEKPALGLGTLLFGAGALTLASEASEFFDGAIDKAKDFLDGDNKIEEEG